MPRFTIELSAGAAGRLQERVARHNDDRGEELSVAGWIRLHLLELAIEQELLQAAQELRRQAEEAAVAAALAERDRLLKAISAQEEPQEEAQ
jgi:hypothetical protein